MKTNEDVVRVIIDGKELTGWEAATIEMAVDRIADGFSITAPWDPSRKELRDAFRPFSFHAAQLYIDDDVYITGRVDKVTPDLSSSDRKINLQGRSLTAQLADCSHDGELEFDDLALSTICRQVCEPFGISVRADNDTAPIPAARAEYGQIAADFLNSLAAVRHILLNSSYKGELVLTWGASLVNKPPGARLVEGKYPVESVDSDFDSTKRYHVFKAAAQFAGMPDIVDTCYDSLLLDANGQKKIHRPHLSVANEALSSPEDVAAIGKLEAEESIWNAADVQSYAKIKRHLLKARTASRVRVASLAESVTVNIGVTGWRRPDGKRWAERQTVTLLAPSAMIYKEVPWLIAGVTLKLDISGGRSTSLRLVLPETYSGTMPKEIPWAD